MADKFINRGGSIRFGADPELFIETSEGQIVGSEKLLKTAKEGRIIRDGVQIELNPAPSPCRGLFGNGIVAIFKELDAKLKAAGYRASFKSVIEVSKEEMETLSEEARKLGCQPSKNFYDAKATITVPADFRQRSAGGHIHLGLESQHKGQAKVLVPLLDTLVGNTCVLVDRDPLAAERRKHYGRAGEFREPLHGLEYRTLSNFWLRHASLMSMVLGLARLSVCVLSTGPDQWSGGFDGPKELLSRVNQDKIRDAINHNDRDLALENFEAIRKFLLEYGPYLSDHGLSGHTCKDFLYFQQKVHEKGIEYWFPKDPIRFWCGCGDTHYHGWENYLVSTVRVQRDAEEAKNSGTINR